MRTATLYLIMFLSGMAGLGYQMAFVRMLSVGLGHEMPSVLAVVGAFFGGLALGAWLLNRRVAVSRHSGRWYIGLELVIGGWGLACAWLIGPANELALVWIGAAPSPVWHWFVSLGVPLLLLLPATFAMGATLPAMESFMAARKSDHRCVGGLYGSNTAGAVAGTLLGAFLLVPAFGYQVTIYVLAGVNFFCALVMIPMLSGAGLSEQPATGEAGPPPAPRRQILAVLFCTGLLGIGYEVIGLRVITQVIENTVYSYAAVLSLYLIGTAVGAAVYQWAGKRFTFDRCLGYLLWGLAVTCLLGIVGLSYSRHVYHAARNAMGDTAWAVLLSEMAVASLAFLLPTPLMGAVFSHLTQAAKRPDGGVGHAVAINTAGSSVAPILIGVLLMPAVGTKWAIVTIAMGYLVLVARFTRIPSPVVLAPLLILLLLPQNLYLIRLFSGQRVIAYQEGIMASVAVVEDQKGSRLLRVNNRFQMGGTGPTSRRFEQRLGLIPLLLHPTPKRALYLGVGTGITAQASASFPDVEADAVELVPEVVAVLNAFAIDGASLLDESSVNVHAADARRFVRSTDQQYDVIVADLFHPARDGGGMLYTREHFRAVRDRLNDGGLFCQWVPLYQVDETLLRVIIRTFMAEFPGARAVLADAGIRYPAVGLVGARGDWPRFAPDWIGPRSAHPELRKLLTGVGIQTDFDLFGLLIAESAGLNGFARDAVVNTDDSPVVVFNAPRFARQRGASSYGRLVKMIEDLHPGPASWGIADSGFQADLARWIEQRDRFIQHRISNLNASR